METADDIVLDCGVRLSYPTEEELEYVEHSLRPGDRMEHDFFGGSLKVPFGMPAWTVRYRGDVVGAGGFCLCSDGGVLSRNRVAWFLSCGNADRHKVAFVRFSPQVLKAMVRTLPAWVDTVFVTPMSDYAMAVRWLERVMGMKTVGTVVDQYCEFKIMMARRKDIEDV